MTEDEKKFLITEYESSWQQILNIDTRRGTFANYYNVSYLGVLAFIANIWSRKEPIALPMMLLITAILVSSVLFARTIKGILSSERAANVKYRKKINLIREILLSDSTDSEIQRYMKEKEIGIYDYSDHIDETGHTLNGIFEMMRIQERGLKIFGAFLWLLFFWEPIAFYICHQLSNSIVY